MVIDSKTRQTARFLFLGLLVLASRALAMPHVRLVEEDEVVLTVRPMKVSVAPGAEPAVRVVKLADRGVELRYEFAWPEPEDVTKVLLRASPRPPRSGVRHVVLLEAEVTMPDGRQERSKRELVFDEEYTSLFDVRREGNRSLILAIEAVHHRETRLAVRREIGEPMQFQLEIQRVEGDNFVSLETNRLNTFVGDSVSYSFRLGEKGQGESLTVNLTPRRLYGDLARISIEVSGMLEDGDTISMISRQEDWMTTRGSTSSLSVAAGDPPAGFRFLVTPWF
jgi:hypothetical protein